MASIIVAAAPASTASTAATMKGWRLMSFRTRCRALLKLLKLGAQNEVNKSGCDQGESRNLAGNQFKVDSASELKTM